MWQIFHMYASQKIQNFPIFFVSKQKIIYIINDECMLRKKSWLGLRPYIDKDGTAADVIKN